MQVIIPNSEMAKKICSSQTKTTTIAKHALAPALKTIMIFRHVKSIISVKYDGGNDQTDKKFFILVRYYDQLQSQTVTHFLALPVPKIAEKPFENLSKIESPIFHNTT